MSRNMYILLNCLNIVSIFFGLIIIIVSPFSPNFTDFFINLREGFKCSRKLFPSLKEIN